VVTRTATEQPEKRAGPGGPLQWGIIVGSWIGFLILPELFFFLWFPLMVILFATSWRRGLLALACSAYTLGPLLIMNAATIGYFTGSAQVISFGMSWHPPNLHREYRCGVGCTGCVPIGYLWVGVPNNLTLKALVWAMGPVKRTYHGPYPTVTQAWQAVDERASSCSYEELSSAGLKLAGGETVTIDTSRFRYWEVSRGHAEYRVAVYKGECVLVAAEDPEHGTWVMLIDRESNEPFACHRTRQESPDGRQW